MKTYYEDRWVKIFHGDCREILPTLPKVDLVLTDPPWLNLTKGMNTEDPERLCRETWQLLPAVTDRAIIILGCDTDPRVLDGLSLPFWNLCWIQRVPPVFKGGKFVGADVAYVFGNFCAPDGRGKKVYSQEFVMRSNRKRENTHPAPRNLRATRDVLSVYSHEGDVVVDPFLGSGTTARAAKDCGRHCIGIEIAEEYCEIAARRCAQESFDFRSTDTISIASKQQPMLE